MHTEIAKVLALQASRAGADIELLTDLVTQLLSATEVQLTEQREQNQTRLSYAES